MLHSLQASPERATGGGERVLYVEGRAGVSRDPHVLTILLRECNVDVLAVGACEDAAAAVRALEYAGEEGGGRADPRPHYCVLDRDQRADDEVEESWRRLKDRESLVVYWRRHEIENYFLEPDFITQSQYKKPGVTANMVATALRKAAQNRVYLDCANLVLKELRYNLRWFDLQEFTFPEGNFGTAKDALATMLNCRPYAAARKRHRQLLSETSLASRFDHFAMLMTGAEAEARLRTDRGRWLDLIEGNKLLGEVMNTRFFTVPDDRGTPLQGDPLQRRVIADLMERFDELAYPPPDLVELRNFFAKGAR